MTAKFVKINNLFGYFFKFLPNYPYLCKLRGDAAGYILYRYTSFGEF